MTDEAPSSHHGPPSDADARRATPEGAPTRIAAAKARLAGVKVAVGVAAVVAFGASALLARATTAGNGGKNHSKAPSASGLSAPPSFLAALNSDNQGGDSGFGSGGSVGPPQNSQQPPVSSGSS